MINDKTLYDTYYVINTVRQILYARHRMTDTVIHNQTYNSN